MLCPECRDHMEFNKETREYYCAHCNFYIDENQMDLAPNWDDLVEESDYDEE